MSTTRYALLLSVAVAASCNGPVTIVVSDQTQALATDAVRARPWQPTEQEPVTLPVDMPHVMSYGQPVPIRVTLHNGTTHPMAIGFGRMQGFDVLVAMVGTRADSGAVWSPLKDASLSGDATITDPLAAGRDTTFEVMWPGTDDGGHLVPRGHYRLRAVVSAALLKTRRIWTPWMPIDVQ